MSDFEQVLAAHRALYPKSEPLDWFKLLYQSEFGCGHMVTDEKACIARVEDEYKTAKGGAPLLEDIGGGYVRLHLGAARDAGYSPALIARAFLLSAQRRDGDPARFLARADALKALIGADAVDALKKEATASGFAPFSHSDAYRAAYQPAYRVILSAYGALLPALKLIETRRAQKRPVLIGLDGRCGAGKTTAAGLIASFFNASVLHMDDFFLPFALRSEKRLSEPGGNIHYERFQREVAEKLARGEAVKYGVFDCSVGQITHEKALENREVILIEGSYALHPAWRAMYDIRLFADVDPAVQRARILARNGEARWSAFEQKWIPMEEKYFSFCQVREACDLILKL